MTTLLPILKRLGFILSIPFLVVLVISYYILGILLSILFDWLIYILTGHTLFMAFIEGRICNKGEMFGPKSK